MNKISLRRAYDRVNFICITVKTQDIFIITVFIVKYL